MKTPKEHIEHFFNVSNLCTQDYSYFKTMIGEIQKDAYNQALEDACENALIDCGETHGASKSFLATDELNFEFGITVSHESILKLKKQ